MKNIHLLECVYLNNYQFKPSRYSQWSIYMNSMVNTNKKPPIDTQTLERNLQKRKDKEEQKVIGTWDRERNTVLYRIFRESLSVDLGTL